jgi:dienelactone hydrolase
LIGSHGGLVEFKAALLASNGFASLALAYVHYDDLPNDLAEIELEYFLEAVQWLKNHPSVTPGGVGIMGISKGAEIALLTASNCNDVKACVFNGGSHSLTYWPLIHIGRILPHIPFVREEVVKTESGALAFATGYSDNWMGAIKDNPRGIALENTDAQLLLIYGSDDNCVNAEQYASMIYNRLKAFGKEGQCTILGYHGAGHLIEPPYAPHFIESYQKSFNLMLAFGGKPKEHAVAQEHAWQRILQFFKEHLPQC